MTLIKFGIPEAVASILSTVARSTQPTTQRALAVETFIDPVELVYLLDQCETDGLLVCVSQTGDGHGKEVRLLPAGRRLVDRIDIVLDSLRRDLLNNIPTTDVSAAVQVLNTLEQRALVWVGKVPI